MPLRPGKKNIGHNIEEMEKAGHPHDQSVAAALHEAYDRGSHMAKGGRTTGRAKAQRILSSAGYSCGGEVKKGVHAHESNMHPGKKETKLSFASGGVVADEDDGALRSKRLDRNPRGATSSAAVTKRFPKKKLNDPDGNGDEARNQNYAKGGREKGKAPVNVNIIIEDPAAKAGVAGGPPGAGMPPGGPPKPPMPPGPGGGMPPGMPPGGPGMPPGGGMPPGAAMPPRPGMPPGGPGLPPGGPGGPPMIPPGMPMRASGGRIGKERVPMKAGAGSGLGRLQKIKEYGPK